MATTTLKTWGMVIDGKSVQSKSGETIETVSPTDNGPIGVVPKAGPEDAELAVAAASRAFYRRSVVAFHPVGAESGAEPGW